MMSSVFSSFDPTLSVIDFSFFFVFLVFTFSPLMYWIIGGLINLGLNKTLTFIFTEAKNLVNSGGKGLSGFMVIGMMGVLLMNFFALFPFWFSSTSHLMFNLPLSYGLWLGVIMFSLYSSFISFLSHLVPLSTPLGLLSFMVIIEFVSNLIRPLALMFRLTANMMAGHLLLSLVGSFLINMGFGFSVLGGGVQSLLVIMELGVSLVQAYVFATLLMLYVSEINH